jgi:type I restriction enzyme M protein
MTNAQTTAATLRAIRASLNLTQEQLAERLGVSFATINRWEGGTNTPQKAARSAIDALAAEAGIGPDEAAVEPAEAAAQITRRRRGAGRSAVPSTKPMEQMLWDAACSIRGEKDAAKFKDYLLPLLFLKRLSDVFDDEIERLAEEYEDRETALEIAETDHELVRFYLPPEARWGVISGREEYDWPLDEKDRSTRPKDIGEHLTKAVRAVVRQNPSLSGVIDVVDFAAERNGERDINPAKLREVVETFSDPRYRLGLADVQPDFLGRAYEYLLRKFAEGSGQSAGEFFTPTEVGFLMAHIMRPKPGDECHDYACGSAGLLVKLQLVARELDPTSKVPLKLYGQELTAESYAVAQMNAIIHDMSVEMARGDTMINPKFKTADSKIRTYDTVVANPMWNQPFNPDIFAEDPFDRFRTQGGISSGKGDWAWLQHTMACLNERGRAAVVLDTGVVTRGSGSRNEDRERNIRKWFVDRDLIDGVILLPDNLFYNTTAAGVIVVLSKRKPAARKDRIVLLNASRRVSKGRPKNYIAEEDIRLLAAAFVKGEPVEGEVAVITREQAEEADYNISPSRWVGQESLDHSASISDLMKTLEQIAHQQSELDQSVLSVLQAIRERSEATTKSKIESYELQIPDGWVEVPFLKAVQLQRGFDLPTSERESGSIPVFGSNGVVGTHNESPEGIPVPGVMVGRSGSVGKVSFSTEPYWPLNTTLFANDFKGNNEKFISYFLTAFDFSRFSQGVSVPTLNRNSFAAQAVALPPPSEQKAIAEVLEAVDKEIDLNEKRRAVLDDLFKVLLRKLTTGEISVADLDLSVLEGKGAAKAAA